MGEKFLDVTKSVIISSPAGSGKTEKLARRYIALLKSGCEAERILSITFTEKAAAEMKARILDILSREDPDMLMRVRAKIPLMRISTIHAFCLRLLKRFSVQLGLDPSLRVADELATESLWSEAMCEALEDESKKPAMFYEMMKERGLKGGSAVVELLNDLHRKRPRPELILMENHPRGQEEEKILALYSECLGRYQQKKLQRGLLDFEDLELMAYQALSSGPEWHNILYAFDEHTDHLLVDEFQDTSSLQWKIIDKLTEEWRSGAGAKREAGKTPTIFLVGDEKQSIYRFRGANPGVFHAAKERFSEWLGDEYRFEEVKENYRSLPRIVEFANSLFGRIMPKDLLDSWRTRYSPFEPVREGDGTVELLLLKGAGLTKASREWEAGLLAKAIAGLHGSGHEIYDSGVKRPCKYSDMVILLNRRTYLGVFEDALRNEGIPFIALRGIGFNDEPEVALLREFVSFIADPSDDYSLFCLLRSPLFGFDYKILYPLLSGDGPLIGRLGKSQDTEKAARVLVSLLERKHEMSLACLIERLLAETGGWAHLWEKQRHANAKKFISLIEGFEAEGLPSALIREKLIRHKERREIPKANINAEGMNAVRMMTVHASKGLQFPMVFIPSLEEGESPRTSSVAVDDGHGIINISYEPDSARKKSNAVFSRARLKSDEEGKRLFYVAVTRAMDYLCMIGSMGGQPKGRLAYFEEAFGITKPGTIDPASLPFRIMTEADVVERCSHAPAGARFEDAGSFMNEPAFIGPLEFEQSLSWRGVTEDLDIRAKHGDDWVLIGSVMHKLLEGLSSGAFTEDMLMDKARTFLRAGSAGKADIERISAVIRGDFGKLRASGILGEIIMPKENSFFELPFNFEKGGTVFKGRMDRLIINDGEARIYDYKTYPVGEGEMPELLRKYRFQMEIYKEAAERLFGLSARAYLIFTHLPEAVEV